MKIIVGLGNRGEKYKLTRHNAGFMAVDALADELGLNWRVNKRLNAAIASYLPALAAGEKNGERSKIILAKPLTYMNDSGLSVRAILKYYEKTPLIHQLAKKARGIIFPLAKKGIKGDLSEILTIVHDDIDIELGKYKISANRGSAGHNGVQSIINALDTKNFRRFRLGIRTKITSHILTDKFVLQKFNEEELKIINEVISEIIPPCLNPLQNTITK